MFLEGFKSFGIYLVRSGDKKFPHLAQNIHQIAVLTLLHPENPGKLSQIILCFKLYYVSKSYVLETVDRGFKNSNLHVVFILCTSIRVPGGYSVGCKVRSTS